VLGEEPARKYARIVKSLEYLDILLGNVEELEKKGKLQTSAAGYVIRGLEKAIAGDGYNPLPPVRRKLATQRRQELTRHQSECEAQERHKMLAIRAWIAQQSEGEFVRQRDVVMAEWGQIARKSVLDLDGQRWHQHLTSLMYDRFANTPLPEVTHA
jgi:predicted transcriptional regulator